MNDLAEIENELRKLRPARPSPILLERIEEAMAEHSAARARWDWRRFTEWVRGAGNNIEGQLARATDREPVSRKAYRLGFALSTAAVLLALAILRMERPQEDQQRIAQSSSNETTAPLPKSEESPSPNRFVSAGATRLIYNTRNEGLQFARGSGQPLRRVRYQTHETWQWRNPSTGASLRVSYPSEEVVLTPVSGQ